MLLVDEAQSLSNELLEELRMLTNIETHSEKLVTLVLVGQPQLADRLNDERLGQLKQRIELRCTLSPFELAETVMYIRNRVGLPEAMRSRCSRGTLSNSSTSGRGAFHDRLASSARTPSSALSPKTRNR